MSRLFRKLFLAIWLCIAGSLIGLFILIDVLGILPPSPEVTKIQSAFALDLAARLTAANGPEMMEAIQAALASASPSLHLDVEEIAGAPLSTCAALGEGVSDTRFVAAGSGCLRIGVSPPDRTWADGVAYLAFPIVTCAFASFFASLWLAHYLAGPILTLKNGLSALAGGDFATRIGDRFGARRDEISDLGYDFDATAAKLDALQAAQQRLYHDVSHELRSPLSRLQAELGVLRRKPARIDPMLARMDREIERLDALVEEILTLARLGSGSDTGIERQRIDVIDLLDAIVGDAAFEGQARDVEVRLEGRESFVAEVDGELLYRALENVVRNALKYTQAGTAVRVRATVERENCLLVSVRDGGPGVAREHLDQMFDPFVRVGDRPSVEGYGLGLAIARRALELHGGRIWAEAGTGGGLAVHMEIPAGGAMDAAAGPRS